MKILIVEDDTAVAASLLSGLADLYECEWLLNSEEVLYKARYTAYGLIVMDLGLPDMSGDQVCRRLRELGVDTPILILTARDECEEKVGALDAGADDYLTKPFQLSELKARLRALLRRPVAGQLVRLMVHGLELDSEKGTLWRDGKALRLRRRAFDILELLMRRQGQAVSRQDIFEAVWDQAADPNANVVDVQISYLRRVIDKPFAEPLIKTVHGFGYTISK